MSVDKIFNVFIVVFIKPGPCDQLSVLIKHSKRSIQSHKMRIVVSMASPVAYPGDRVAYVTGS